MEPGHNATYPTFLHGEVVIKLFGWHGSWAESLAGEVAAMELVIVDPEIRAPRILARGQLFEDGEHRWPYLVTSRLTGEPIWRANLDPSGRLEVAAALGDLVRRLQAIPPDGLPELGELPIDHVLDSARRSSLPPGLLDQVPDFLAAHPARGAAFVHGDLVQNHVYVREGRLEGVIDWGDALAADPAFELGKLFFGALRRDRGELAAFLEVSGWARAEDFAPRALAQAILRQAKGLLQHRGFDVFDGLGEVVRVDRVASLEALARELFGP